MEELSKREKDELRINLLKAAYETHMRLPERPFDIRQSGLAAKWGIPSEELTRAFEYLDGKRLIEIVETLGDLKVDYMARITTEGIDFIEGPGPFYMPNIYELLSESELTEEDRNEIVKMSDEFEEQITPEKIGKFAEFLDTHAPWIAEAFARFIKSFVSPL